MEKNTISYQDIFNDITFEEGENSRSVLSPAAYFADLLYLKEDIGQDDALKGRREDLKTIDLNRDNTYNLVPYLDIANRVMTTYLGGNRDQILEDSKYPFNKPFALPMSPVFEEAKAALEYLKTDPAEFYKTFSSSVDAKTVARLMLGLSENAFKYITEEKILSNDLKAFWGMDGSASHKISDLSDLKTFLEFSMLTEKELREILYQDCNRKTELVEGDEVPASSYNGNGFFINNGIFGTAGIIDEVPAEVLVIDENESEAVNSLIIEQGRYAGTKKEGEWLRIVEVDDYKFLAIDVKKSGSNDPKDWVLTPPTFDYYDRMHRFIRLARVLGWSFIDTDRVLMTICNGKLDSDSIVLVALAKHFVDSYRLSVEEVCNLFAPMRSFGVGESLRSIAPFDDVFNNSYDVLDEISSLFDKSDEEISQRLMSVLGLKEKEFQNLFIELEKVTLPKEDSSVPPAPVAYTLQNLVKDKEWLTQLYSVVLIAKNFNMSVTDLLDFATLLQPYVETIGSKRVFNIAIPVRPTNKTIFSVLTRFAVLPRITPEVAGSTHEADLQLYKDIMLDKAWILQVITTVKSWMDERKLTISQLSYILNGDSSEYINGVLPKKDEEQLEKDIVEAISSVLINESTLPQLAISESNKKLVIRLLTDAQVISSQGLFVNIDTKVGESDESVILQLLKSATELQDEKGLEAVAQTVAVYLNDFKEKQLETLYLLLENSMGYPNETIRVIAENVLKTKFEEPQRVLAELVESLLGGVSVSDNMEVLQRHLLMTAKVGLTKDELKALIEVHTFRDTSVEIPASVQVNTLPSLNASHLPAPKAVLVSEDNIVGFNGSTPYVIEGTQPVWFNWIPQSLPEVHAAFKTVDAIYLCCGTEVYELKNGACQKVKLSEVLGVQAHNLTINGVVNALFKKGNKLYLLSGNQLFRYTLSETLFIDPEFPKVVSPGEVIDDITLPTNFAAVRGAYCDASGTIQFVVDTFITGSETSFIAGDVVSGVTFGNVDNSGEKLYIFVQSGTETNVVRYSNPEDAYLGKSCDIGFPRSIGTCIEEGWSELPDGYSIKSALTYTYNSENRTLLFKKDAADNTKYVSSEDYSDIRTVDDLWIQSGQGLFTSIDAAFVSDNGWSYLFSGSQYVRYNTADYGVIADNSARALSDFNIPTAVKGACIFPVNPVGGQENNGFKTFLFFDNAYKVCTIDNNGNPINIVEKTLDQFELEGANYPSLSGLDIVSIFSEEESDGSHTMYIYHRENTDIKLRVYSSKSGDYSDRELSEALTNALGTELNAVLRGVDGIRYYFGGTEFTYTSDKGVRYADKELINTHFGRIGAKGFNNIDTAFAANGYYYFLDNNNYIKTQAGQSGFIEGFIIEPGYPQVVSSFMTNEGFPANISAQGDIAFYNSNQYTICNGTKISNSTGVEKEQFDVLGKLNTSWLNSGVVVTEANNEIVITNGSLYAKTSKDSPNLLLDGYPKAFTKENWESEALGSFPVVEAGSESLLAAYNKPTVQSGANGEVILRDQITWIKTSDLERLGTRYNPLMEDLPIERVAIYEGYTYLFSSGYVLKYNNAKELQLGFPMYEAAFLDLISSKSSQFPKSVETEFFTGLVQMSTGYRLFKDSYALAFDLNGNIETLKTKVFTPVVDVAHATSPSTQYHFYGELLAEISSGSLVKVAPIKSIGGSDTITNIPFDKGITSVIEHTELDGSITYIVISDDKYAKTANVDLSFSVGTQVSETWKLANNSSVTLTLFELAEFYMFKVLSGRFDKTDNSILDFFKSGKNRDRLCTVTGWEDSDIEKVEEIISSSLLSIIDVYSINSIHEYADKFNITPSKLKSQVWDAFFKVGFINTKRGAKALFNFQFSDVDKQDRAKVLKEYNRARNAVLRDALVGAAILKRSNTVWDEISETISNLRVTLKTATGSTKVGIEKKLKRLCTLETPRDLYAYFLSDVMTNEEAETSQIKEATLAMQLYFHRFLMGLEEVADNKTALGDENPNEAPFEKDLKQWWEWMKNYRVWEANRKVFLYPENYIRPELRTEKSPQFEALEEAILESDLTDNSVVSAFNKYLDDFAIVSQLKVVGGYIYQDKNSEVKKTMMFGKTSIDPLEYYYATGELFVGEVESDDPNTPDIDESKRDFSLRWDAWKKIKVPIRSEEVQPIHVFDRSFVFWMEYQQGESTLGGNSGSLDSVESKDMFEPILYCSFKNLNDEWSAPQKMLNVYKHLTEEIDFYSGDEAVHKARRNLIKADFEKPGSLKLYLIKEIDDTTGNEYIRVGFDCTNETHWLNPKYYKFSNTLKVEFDSFGSEEIDDQMSEEEAAWNKNLPGYFHIDSDETIVWRNFTDTDNDEDEPWYNFNTKGGSFLCVPNDVIYTNKSIDSEISKHIDAGYEGFNGLEVFSGEKYCSLLASDSDRYTSVEKLRDNSQPADWKDIASVWGNPESIFTNHNPLWGGKNIVSTLVIDSKTYFVLNNGFFLEYEDSTYTNLDGNQPKRRNTSIGGIDEKIKDLQDDKGLVQYLFNDFYDEESKFIHNAFEFEGTFYLNVNHHVIFVGTVQKWVECTQENLFSLLELACHTPEEFAAIKAHLNNKIDKITFDSRGLLLFFSDDKFVFTSPTLSFCRMSGYHGDDAVNCTLTDLGCGGFPRLRTAFRGTDGALHLFPEQSEGICKYVSHTGSTATTAEDVYKKWGIYNSYCEIDNTTYKVDAAVVIPDEGLYIFAGARYVIYKKQYSGTAWSWNTSAPEGPYEIAAHFEDVATVKTALYGQFDLDVDNPEQNSLFLFSAARKTSSDGLSRLSKKFVHNGTSWEKRNTTSASMDDWLPNNPEMHYHIESFVRCHDDKNEDCLYAFSENVLGTYPYVKFQGKYSFPYLNKATEYDIVRLTSNTAEQLIEKLSLGDLSQLLSYSTQTDTIELPKFSNTINYRNDTVYFNSKYFRKAPNSEIAPDGGVTNIPGLDFNGVARTYYWEIFFHIPFLIANTLKNQQRFEASKKWFEFVFNPIQENISTETDPIYWIFKEFYNDQKLFLEQEAKGSSITLAQTGQIKAFYDDPFNPHAVAEYRPVAYRKAFVMSYIDMLLDWGDLLFTQYTRESINEARMLYVLAYDLLGKKPVSSGNMLHKDTLDYDELTQRNVHYQYTNVTERLVNFENEPVNTKLKRPLTTGNFGTTPNDTMLLGEYFFLPENEQFVTYWNRVEDRLTKIRNGQNIDGIKVPLALFQPPIDPMAIVSALGSGSSLGQAIGGLNGTVPHYRYQFIVSKAKELASRLNQLSGALLSALEKKDSEELALIRNKYESEILELTKEIKESQLEDRKNSLDVMKANLASANFRKNHYIGLQNEGLIKQEQVQLASLITGQVLSTASNALKVGSAIAAYVPNVGSPFAITYGGIQLSSGISFASTALDALAGYANFAANMASITGGHERRRQDWKFQEDLAANEIVQLEKQMVGTNIQIEIAKQEIKQVEKQMKHNESITDFMTSKFTNKELYQWMASKLSGLFYQSYQLALDLAKEAQQAFRFELGLKESEVNYLTSYYWDSQRKGLLAGDVLMNDIAKMEKGYMDKNARRAEISKSISLLRLDPKALLDLKKDKVCSFTLPEKLFALDFPNHYCRQIKSISITIPATVGPFQNINATLSQQSHYTLLEPDVNSMNYLLNPEEGELTEHVRADWRGQQEIAISNGTNDSGLFQLNFNDERYLPFEGTGVHSTWQLELNSFEGAFDVNTITDVIINISYTSKQGGALFGEEVKSKISETSQIETRYFNVPQVFSVDWRRFKTGESSSLNLTIKREMFPGIGDGTLYDLYIIRQGETIDKVALSIGNKIDEDGTELSIADLDPSLKDMVFAFTYERKFSF